MVRITPDEIHVQEQLYNLNDADGWIKGTKVLESGRHQSERGPPRFQIRKRSISRVRSILQLEVHHIIRGLVQKHQVHRVFSSRIQPFIALPALHEARADPSEESDLEDGYHNLARRSMPSAVPEMYLPPKPLAAKLQGSAYAQPSLGQA